MRAHRVRALLMGGQACVFYGAAEFSRDTEEDEIRILDKTYWIPLLKELEALRHPV
jgi:hypothetical protein